MRPQAILVILLLGGGLFGLVAYFSTPPAEPTPNVLPKAPTTPDNLNLKTANSATMSASVPTPNTSGGPAIAPASSTQPTNRAVDIADRVNELMSLAMQNDSNSFNVIWSALSDPDKEIRAAALDAVIQFGDHSVTPRLRELAGRTTDTDEKNHILQAADFLDLSPLEFKRPANPPPEKVPSP
jgi:HEAT repeats